MRELITAGCFLLTMASAYAESAQPNVATSIPGALKPLDIFNLEWADSPTISPSSEKIAFVRNGLDIMTDKRISTLWLMDRDGGNLEQIGRAHV